MTAARCGRSRVVGAAVAAVLLVGATASADTGAQRSAGNCVAHFDSRGWKAAIAVSGSSIASLRVTGLPDACAGLPATLTLYGDHAGDASAPWVAALFDSSRSCPAARAPRVTHAQLEWARCGPHRGVGVSARDVTAFALTFTSPGESATEVLGEKQTRRPVSRLPFTGLPALWLAVLGVVVLAVGWVASRRPRAARPPVADRFQQH